MTLESAPSIELRDGPAVTDIGGRAAGGGRFRRGLLYRMSGALAGPADLTGLELRQLVDLRADEEDRAVLMRWCTEHDVTYTHVPIALGDPAEMLPRMLQAASSPEAAVDYVRSLYVRILDEHGHAFAAAVDALCNRLPAGFGCAGGKDRTGILTLLIQDVAGVDHADVVTDYLGYAPGAERLRTFLRHALPDVDFQGPTMDVFLGTSEEPIRAVLAHLGERWGSAAAYLLAHGASGESLLRLREQLVEP